MLAVLGDAIQERFDQIRRQQRQVQQSANIGAVHCLLGGQLSD
jgi:hypothetical protein